MSVSSIHITLCQPSHPSICKQGCQLLYNENLNCISKQAFIPSEYITNIEVVIEHILNSELYICYIPSNSILSDSQTIDTNPQDTTSSSTTTNNRSTFAMFDFDSYVLIWQAIIISIIVPLIAVILFKLTLIIFHKIFEIFHCNDNNNHKCISPCCLYCCSAEYRQQKRNRKLHNVNNHNNGNNNNNWKWKINRKKNNNNHNNNIGNHNNNNINIAPVIVGENDIDFGLENNNNNNHYQHVPLNEIDNNNNENIPPNVLEEVSVEHNEMNKYLQAPGGNNQDIELSFSSQGLRQISYRDVV